jgi:hypothetical protein
LGVLALGGYPLGSFFLFFFFPFLGSCWQPFSYVLALLAAAILKTKSAKIMCFFGIFQKPGCNQNPRMVANFYIKMLQVE